MPPKQKVTQQKRAKATPSYAEFALTTLLSLQKRLRWASLDEVRFIIVNESKELIPFQQAILWEGGKTTGLSKEKVTAVSGVAVLDHNVPYLQFISELLATVLKAQGRDKSFAFMAKDLSCKKLQKHWAEFLPERLWFQQLYTESGDWLGCLILARSQAWQGGEVRLISDFSDAISAAIIQKHNETQKPTISQRIVNNARNKPLLWGGMLLVLFCPVRLSTLAPAEVIAMKPKLIRAPLEGVIADILVKPNQKVSQGDTLIQFDTAEVEAKFDVAKGSLKVTELELRQVAQTALKDPAARARLVSIQGQMEKDKTDIAYLSERLKRATVRADQEGVVVFEDAYDWLGRPVSIGEKMMLLASPDQTELEIRLPVQQIMNFPEQTEIQFFSNVRPHKPYQAELSFFSYRATKTQDQNMAYRLKATWRERNESLRLGLKGTAKIYGRYRPLIWHPLRRPIGVLRQWLGL